MINIKLKVYKDTLNNYIAFKNLQVDSLLKYINNGIVNNIDSIYAGKTSKK